MRSFLTAIACPVLAIRAHPGWPFDDEQIADRLAVIPRLERVDLAGGHHLHLTHPERVAPALAAFLSGPDATG